MGVKVGVTVGNGVDIYLSRMLPMNILGFILFIVQGEYGVRYNNAF
jgi:hypothetical protein